MRSIALAVLLPSTLFSLACNLVKETPTHHAVHAGEIATLAVPGQNSSVWMAADSDASSLVTRALGTKDSQALERLRAAGKAWEVEHGAQVRVVAERFNDRKVTIVSAQDAGRTGWVPYEWLEPVPLAQR